MRAEPDSSVVPAPLPDRPGVDLAWSAAVAVVVLVVYLTTLPPSITFEDSGEFVSVATHLGIAHSPGYPLYTLLAHLFSRLPFGPSLAWRVNLFSACCGAVAAGVLYLAGRRLRLPRSAAFAAGLLSAFTRSFWSQAIVAEVYALNALFFALLLLALRWQASRDRQAWLWFCFAYGLAFTNHFLALLLAPGFVLWFVLVDWRTALQPRRVALGVSVFAAGLLVFLYLPIRSAMEPLVDWGNPQTWNNFWHMLRRSQFANLPRVTDGVPVELLRNLWQMVTALVLRELPPWVAPLALWGVVRLARTQRAFLAMSLLVFGLNTVVLLLIMRPYCIPPNLFGFRVFYLSAYQIYCLWAAFGVAGLGQVVGSRCCAAAVGPVLALLLCGSTLATNWRANDLSRDRSARLHAAAILRTLPAGAALVGLRSDGDILPLMYAQLVENERPDVLILDDFGLVFNRDAGRPLLDHVLAGKSALNAYRAQIRELARRESGRRVFYAAQKDAYDAEVVPVGILFEEKRPGLSPQAPDFGALYREILALTPSQVPNYAGRTVIARYHVALALALLQASDTGAAEQAFARARAFAAGSTESLAALQIAWNRHGYFVPGEECFHERLRLAPSQERWARSDQHGSRLEYLTGRTPQDEAAVEVELRGLLAADPDRATARKRLGLIVFERGRRRSEKNDYQAAAKDLQEALRLGYKPAWSQCFLGICRLGLGERETGLALMRRAADTPGVDVGVVRNLAVMLGRTGHAEEARQAWQRVLALSPDDPAARRALGR